MLQLLRLLMLTLFLCGCTGSAEALPPTSVQVPAKLPTKPQPIETPLVATPPSETLPAKTETHDLPSAEMRQQPETVLLNFIDEALQPVDCREDIVVLDNHFDFSQWLTYPYALHPSPEDRELRVEGGTATARVILPAYSDAITLKLQAAASVRFALGEEGTGVTSVRLEGADRNSSHVATFENGAARVRGLIPRTTYRWWPVGAGHIGSYYLETPSAGEELFLPIYRDEPYRFRLLKGKNGAPTVPHRLESEVLRDRNDFPFQVEADGWLVAPMSAFERRLVTGFYAYDAENKIIGSAGAWTATPKRKGSEIPLWIVPAPTTHSGRFVDKSGNPVSGVLIDEIGECAADGTFTTTKTFVRFRKGNWGGTSYLERGETTFGDVSLQAPRTLSLTIRMPHAGFATLRFKFGQLGEEVSVPYNETTVIEVPAWTVECTMTLPPWRTTFRLRDEMEETLVIDGSQLALREESFSRHGWAPLSAACVEVRWRVTKDIVLTQLTTTDAAGCARFPAPLNALDSVSYANPSIYTEPEVNPNSRFFDPNKPNEPPPKYGPAADPTANQRLVLYGKRTDALPLYLQTLWLSDVKLEGPVDGDDFEAAGGDRTNCENFRLTPGGYTCAAPQGFRYIYVFVSDRELKCVGEASVTEEGMRFDAHFPSFYDLED